MAEHPTVDHNRRTLAGQPASGRLMTAASAAATNETPDTARPRNTNVFAIVFAVFAATTVAPLLLGLAALVVAQVSALQEAAAARATGAGLGAELAHALAQGHRGDRPFALVTVDYVISAVNIGFATFLVSRRPYDWVARLLAIGMVGTAVAFNYDAHGVVFEGPGFLSTHHLLVHAVAGAAYVHGVLLFPDGRLTPWWSRWVLGAVYGATAIVLIGAITTPPFADEPREQATRLLVSLEMLFFAWFFGMLVPLIGITAQGHRYWSGATPELRQQSKLLLTALLLSLGLGLAYLASAGGHAIPLTWEALRSIEWDFPIVYFNLQAGEGDLARETLERAEQPLFQSLLLLFAVIPVALFIAILRYRLWEMDLVVSRTLTYSLLTAGLGALYIALIVGFQALFRPITAGNDLAIVLTTLIVAALFLPARRRVQDAVDRRFNRRAYNAARTLEAFGQRLRYEVDLDDLRGDLVEAVNETMQPRTVSLWLRPLERNGHTRYRAAQPRAASEAGDSRR